MIKRGWRRLGKLGLRLSAWLSEKIFLQRRLRRRIRKWLPVGKSFELVAEEVRRCADRSGARDQHPDGSPERALQRLEYHPRALPPLKKRRTEASAVGMLLPSITSPSLDTPWISMSSLCTSMPSRSRSIPFPANCRVSSYWQFDPAGGSNDSSHPAPRSGRLQSSFSSSLRGKSPSRVAGTLVGEITARTKPFSKLEPRENSLSPAV